MHTQTKPAYFVDILPNGKWAFFVDSSLLSSFSQCPRQFFYKYIMLQRRKGMPGAMSIGSWWSRTLELFYMNMQSRQKANAGYVTRDEMMTFAADSWLTCQNCKHRHGGAACMLPDCKCDQLRNMEAMATLNPKAYEKFGGAKGAIVMAAEYYDRIGGLDNTNLKIISSEAGFGLKGELVLFESNELIIHYVGKPDLVVYDSGAGFLAPLDHKTVDRVRSDLQRKYKPHNQTTGYIWATGVLAKGFGYDVPVDRCIINVAGREIPAEKPKDGKKKPRFTRVYPNYSPSEIEEWKNNVIYKVHQMYEVLLRGADDPREWEMRDTACHLYGGCDFRGVDAVAPANRPAVLGADYVTVEPWIPYDADDGDDPDSN